MYPFVYLKGKETDLLSAAPLPKWSEAGSQELHPHLPHGCRSPSTWVFYTAFPGTLATCIHMGCWHCRDWLSHYIATPAHEPLNSITVLIFIFTLYLILWNSLNELSVW